MKSLLLLLVIVLVAQTVSADIFELTNENFVKSTSKGKWFVMFYAPWCGHCKNLKPTWNDLSNEANKDFNVGMVDCTKETQIASKFGIKGYPTVYFMENDKMVKYTSERKKESFMKFAETHNFNGENNMANPVYGMTPPKPTSEGSNATTSDYDEHTQKSSNSDNTHTQKSSNSDNTHTQKSSNSDNTHTQKTPSKNTKTTHPTEPTPTKVAMMENIYNKSTQTFKQVKEMSNNYPTAVIVFAVCVFTMGFYFGRFTFGKMFTNEATHTQTTTQRKGYKKD